VNSPPWGNPIRNVSQGGGASIPFSGGDERSEPENADYGNGQQEKDGGNGNRSEVESNSSTNPSGSPAVAILDDDTGPGRCGPPGPPAAALSCLNSNSCTEKREIKHERLSPFRRKSRLRLIIAVEWLVRKYGLNHVGMLTLTFGVPGSGKGSEETRVLREKAKDLEFVQKRWHSFATHIVSKRYDDWVCVLETHRDGVWHFHVVVATKIDIRTGTDIETLSNYSLPAWMRSRKQLRSDALAAEWTELRKICCKYHFGRSQLLPIKKNGEAVARYVAGYLSKSWARVPPGRKSRLVRFSRGLSGSISMRFSPNTLGNLIYRTRLKLAASMLPFDRYDDFEDYLGPRWHCYLGDVIATIPVPLVFAKGEFESGLAAKRLNEYVANPYPYLDDTAKKKMRTAHSDVLRKFTELAFDESAKTRGQDFKRVETDNADLGPGTEAEAQTDLFESSRTPFR
jgi:hypothetical protein